MVVRVQDPVDLRDAEMGELVEHLATPKVDQHRSVTRLDDVHIARVFEQIQVLGYLLQNFPLTT